MKAFKLSYFKCKIYMKILLLQTVQLDKDEYRLIIDENKHGFGQSLWIHTEDQYSTPI